MESTPVPTCIIRELANVSGSDADNRLSLRYIEVADRRGSEFLELVWLRNTNGCWERVALITAARFQQGSNCRRFVIELHSFDSDQATAILKVGEADTPGESRGYNIQYSWRAFSLSGTDHLAVLQHCSHPFEHYRNDG